jgi:Flp pilus assembly protein TadG
VSARARRSLASHWRRLCAGRDEGAVTLMVAVVAAALFLMVGLSVDGGGRMRALERADDMAAEAARAAGQAINLPQAVTGTADVLDPTRAEAAARAYLAGAGVDSFAVRVINGGRAVQVTVTITYQPIFLGLIGLGPWAETSTETAALLTG